MLLVSWKWQNKSKAWQLTFSLSHFLFIFWCSFFFKSPLPFGATVVRLCYSQKRNDITSNLMLFVHVTWCWMATEFINLVLYVFSVWLCVHIRWLDWPSCYTTLAWVRHCFPSHYPRSGQRSLQGGNVTRRIARWTFQDGHLVSFYLFFFSFGLFPFILSHVVHFLLSLPLETTVLLISSVVFIFVILVCCFDYCPTPTPLSLSATAAACVWLNSVQVATAYRWDVYHTWDARRITNTLLSCHPLLLT